MFTEEDGAALIDAPIPGEGLVSDPDNPHPWETPPEYVRVEEFIDDLFMNVTNPDNKDGVLDAIRKGVPIEDVAQLLLFSAFQSGKINPDLMLGSIEPTIYMLIGLAEYAGIPNPVLYPEDEMIDEEDDIASELEKEAMKGVKFEDMTLPQGVSESLLSKIKGEANGD